jgi:hypothetical protein
MSKKMFCLVSLVLLMGLVLTSMAKSADPELAAHWKFDEGSGTTAFDSTGNGNDGIFVGDPKWVPGRLGGALEFDGDDYLNCGNGPSLQIQDAITIAFWFKVEAFQTTWEAFFSKGDNSYRTSRGGGDGDATHFGLSGTSVGDGNGHFNGTVIITGGDWRHFAGTYDGTEGRIYIDGVLDVTSPGTGQINISTYELWIGTNSQNTGRLLHGLMDDVRIYSRALTEYEIQEVMIGMPPELASNPSPANEATDVPRDVVLSWTPGEFAAPTNGHKVYFGESFDDVNDAAGGVAQSAASYAPAQRLDFGTTYYWRVDEVNAPPTSHIEFKGDVWQFSTEPVAYPIDVNNITVTASSSGIDQGPENTVNGSGLDVNDLDFHSTELTDMWLSDFAGPQPTWIQYEFDNVCKLHQMKVWNHNTLSEPSIGYGVKEATIEYSADGANWTTLGTTSGRGIIYEFARAPGAPGYAYNTTVDLEGVAVKYVRLTANSNWGGIVPLYGLSEVRFLYKPVCAREPSPDSDATDVDVDVTLSFRAGREAVTHEVYLSSDEQVVIDGNAPVTTVTETGYGPLSLDLGKTYYWRVDEVNEAETPTTWQGDICNFTTQEYLVVDDFESYNDLNPDDPDSNRIFLTWIDGYDNPAINGSVVGYVEAPFAEQSIVHGGSQSMPFFYDNSTADYSEATANVAALQVGQDWTRHGIKALTLRFFGDPNNAVQQMYVKVNGSKVVYDGDAENLKRIGWQMWYIDLAALGVSLSNVTELSIGFERSGAVGGQGVVYFDGIRLYSHDRQLITPAEPNTAGLVGHWKLDGDTLDYSGLNNHGTAGGDPTFVVGKVGSGALSFDGIDDSVEVPDGPALDLDSTLTITVWVNVPDLDLNAPAPYFLVCKQPSGTAGDNYPGNYEFRIQANTGILEFGHQETEGEQFTFYTSDSSIAVGQWYHVAVTVTKGEFVEFYIDGVAAGSAEQSTNFGVLNDEPVRIGVRKDLKTSFNTFFNGLLDDVRIYDYSLSYGEIGWLAGRTLPFDKPF